MLVYLAGNAPWRGGMYNNTIYTYKPYILESFYYADDVTEALIPYFGGFLLDSGAFTFMQNKKTANIDWNAYIDKYATFIKKNKVKTYFELDIDSIVGYEKVKDFRKAIEDKTGVPSIPVWHKSRGYDEFLKLCEEYSYIALGGIVSGEIKPEQYKAFPKLITEAHKRKCKIHRLGFTRLSLLSKYHFDSVDSTAWTTGNRFGYIYKFNGKTITKIQPAGKRLGNPRKAALINYTEWLKFQKYAQNHL